jgi:hypothetical protein
MNRRPRKISAHISVTIVFTAITGIHAAAAWAADGGTTTADAGQDAADAPDAGVVDHGCGGLRTSQRGAPAAVVFGAGCC